MTAPANNKPEGFSDEDLKKLKDLFQPTDKGIPIMIGTPVNKLKALLARLDAAECIVKIVEKTGDGSLWNECEAWRKATGK